MPEPDRPQNPEDLERERLSLLSGELRDDLLLQHIEQRTRELLQAREIDAVYEDIDDFNTLLASMVSQWPNGDYMDYASDLCAALTDTAREQARQDY